VVIGLIFGVRLARHAQKKGQLLDHSHGLPPIEPGEDGAADPEKR